MFFPLVAKGGRLVLGSRLDLGVGRRDTVGERNDGSQAGEEVEYHDAFSFRGWVGK